MIESLDCAGAEKSLVTLLSMLDFEKVSVDLQLFSYGQILEDLVPKEVNILKPIQYTLFSQYNLKDSLVNAYKQKNYNMLISRFRYSTFIRMRNYRNSQKARIYWENTSNVIESNSKKYDVAISFAQGVPTFYVSEKVHAEKKFAWVNVSYKLKGKDKDFQKKHYDKFDKIVAVSESANEIFLDTFPIYKKKTTVIYDINNPEFISSMADIGNGYTDNFNGIRILTIGRLAKQKGYDIAIETCRKLRDIDIDFRWYVLGKGPLKKEIEQLIIDYNLKNHFILLGVEANPYPFIKNADIYVQTSKFEGYGLALAEARMLNVPIVTTRFDAVYNQMIDGKNGLVVDMEAEAVSKGIVEIINNDQLREDIIDYLKVEKKGNLEEIQKFYQLIG